MNGTIPHTPPVLCCQNGATNALRCWMPAQLLPISIAYTPCHMWLSCPTCRPLMYCDMAMHQQQQSSDTAPPAQPQQQEPTAAPASAHASQQQQQRYRQQQHTLSCLHEPTPNHCSLTQRHHTAAQHPQQLQILQSAGAFRSFQSSSSSGSSSGSSSDSDGNADSSGSISGGSPAGVAAYYVQHSRSCVRVRQQPEVRGYGDGTIHSNIGTSNCNTARRCTQVLSHPVCICHNVLWDSCTRCNLMHLRVPT